MSYIRAEDVLPSDLLEIVQEYANGVSLYIPKKNTDKKTWGSVNGTKEYYAERNAAIYADYADGSSAAALSSKYGLSEKTLQRIIKHCQDYCPT